MATEDKRIDQLPAVSVLDLTSLLAMQQGTEARKVTLQQLLNYLNDNVDTKNVVLYVAQSLTEEQKLQARTNIGAAAPGEGGGSAANAVLYIAQTLTEDQQHQARMNIRCGSVGKVADNCVVSSNYSHAEGYKTTASGFYSHAEGNSTTASGYYDHAEGWLTNTSGHCSHAEGNGTTASGNGGHAEGYITEASGNYSHAEGWYTIAHGYASHSEGGGTTASGDYSHAEGQYTVARGYASHSEGADAVASGDYSHAEGFHTKAARLWQHVQGLYNIEDTEGVDGAARGKYAHIVGNGTANDARSNAHTLDWDGVPWFAGDRVMLGGTGMDDEAAVALRPIFAEQTFTEAQKLQARTNIGAVGANELTDEVEAALTVAKESGEFDGPAGPQGPAGYTPVKGTDYYTEADKQELVTLVLAALPAWEGGSY